MFLVKMKNAFVPISRVFRVNTYSRISTVPQLEGYKGVSEVSERALERSERAEQECEASVALKSK